MKKKLSLFLVSVFALSSFAIAACTDKKEEQPRSLNQVEQSIVGRWEDIHTRTGVYYIFYSDGYVEKYGITKEGSGVGAGEISRIFKKSFNQSGGDCWDGQRTYYTIKADRDYWLYANEPDKLYYSPYTDECFLSRV